MAPEFDTDVLVLSKPSCVQCNATYRALDERDDLTYEVRDMSIEPELLEYAKSLGYLQAPVVLVRGEHWSGFDPDRIKMITPA